MDILMDLGMLVIAQLAFGSLRIRRLLAGAGTLAACTVLALAANISPLAASLLHLPVFILSAQIATGERRPGRIAEAAACMFCAGALAAGFISMGGGPSPLPALAGGLLFLFLLRRRRHENYRWNIEVYVEKDGLSASFPALIDTGNRLREHGSGYPVLIVEAGAIPRLAALAEELDEDEIRTLPFGVLGSTGEINCFYPDRLEIILPGEGGRTAPPCWLAVYPGRIPGATRALAPPAFAGVLARRIRFGKHLKIE